MSLKSYLLAITLICACAISGYAQKSKTLTNDDISTSPSVTNTTATPTTSTTPLSSPAKPSISSTYVDLTLSFSATLKNTDRKGVVREIGKVYVDKGNYRFEMKAPEKKGNTVQDDMIFIKNSIDKSYILMSKEHVYMENMGNDTSMGAMVLGMSNPEYRESLGTEEIEGQVCNKYLLHDLGSQSYLWVNQKTQLPVRLINYGDQIDWINVTVGAQPASLFQVPKDYKTLQEKAKEDFEKARKQYDKTK